MNADLVEKLKVELIEQLNLEEITPDEIDAAAPLFGDGLGLDSIDALEIIVLLEKEYGIKITDQALGKEAMQSINSLAAFIKSNSK
ncbi:MAG: acyl carrier protein [Prolixibacteraceae bacterium]|nr:acyl carrier protein [Prolixibacteraceae bacterium]